MRKICLLNLVVVALTFSAQAQTPAGRWLVTGGLGLSSASTADALDRRGESRGVSISPSVGYFIADHFAVGLTGGVGGYRSESENPANAGSPATTQINRTGSYRVALFGRYYWHVGEKTALTATLSGGIGRSHYEQRLDPQPDYTSQTEQRTRSLSASLTPAFVYFPVPRLGLEVSLGDVSASYNKVKNETTGPASQTYESTTKSLGANFSLYSLNVGGSYFFGGGQ